MRASEYFAACRNHDWFYSYSDDRNVYRGGVDEEKRLKGIAGRIGGVFGKMWADWCRHIGSLSEGRYTIREPLLSDYILGEDPDVDVDTPAPHLSPETQLLLDQHRAAEQWKRALDKCMEEDAKRWALFHHPDGTVAAIMAADVALLERMMDIRHRDVMDIAKRLTPKDGDVTTMVIYGAEFRGLPDGIHHTRWNGGEMVFDSFRRMLLFIAAVWH